MFGLELIHVSKKGPSALTQALIWVNISWALGTKRKKPHLLNPAWYPVMVYAIVYATCLLVYYVNIESQNHINTDLTSTSLNKWSMIADGKVYCNVFPASNNLN